MLLDNFRKGAPEFIDSMRKSNDKIVAFSVLRTFVAVGGKVVIVGKGASGKDTMLNELVSMYSCFRKIIWNTSRPKRNGEVDHLDYHFENRFSRTEVLYNKTFNIGDVEWNYWLNSRDWLSGNITVGTPDFVKSLDTTGERQQTLVMYIDEPDDVRAHRLSVRNDADSVSRRIESDKEDFSYFDNFDYCMSEGKFRVRDEQINYDDAIRNGAYYKHER